MNNTAVNNNLSTFPAVTQRALETMNTARNAWLEARRQQKAAADNIAKSASVALKWKPRRTH